MSTLSRVVKSIQSQNLKAESGYPISETANWSDLLNTVTAGSGDWAILLTVDQLLDLRVMFDEVFHDIGNEKVSGKAFSLKFSRQCMKGS